MRVLTCEQMRQVEKNVVNLGGSYLQLMQNAGRAAYKTIAKHEKALEGKTCVVLCGSGNNGGDGFAVARRLTQAGATVTCVLAGGAPSTLEANEMLKLLEKCGCPILQYADQLTDLNSMLLECDIIIDALFGTGFRGILPEKLNLIAEISAMSEAKVYALDIPSGMEGDSGLVEGKCFKADITICFEALKPAHLVLHEKDMFGIIEVVSIGIHEDAYAGVACRVFYIDEYMVYTTMPKRRLDANKGDFGKLFCLCGSYGMTGAAALSAKAAYRSGAGLVYMGVTEKTQSILAAQLVEPVYVQLPGNDMGTFSYKALPAILDFLENASCCLIGCGMGLNEDTQQLVYELVRRSSCPLVIDADGLNALSRRIDILQERRTDIILTPHPGEMARLIGRSVEYVNQNRGKVASDLAVRYGITVVLKGANTVIASPDGNLFINGTGNPGLAKAGTGDLLAGTIASLAAQGISPVQAAQNGVYLHGMAGDFTAERLCQYSMMATDILDDYHKAFKECDR